MDRQTTDSGIKNIVLVTMILGIGSDIIENTRIAQLYQRHGERFLERVYTKGEYEYALSHSDPIPYLAARFAAKEAAIKALSSQASEGTEQNRKSSEWKNFGWKDIEVCGKTFGKKRLAFHKQAHELAEKLKVRHYHISLSHCDSFSIAMVILES